MSTPTVIIKSVNSGFYWTVALIGALGLAALASAARLAYSRRHTVLPS